MVDFGELKKEQLKLAKKVSIVDSVKNIKTIGGVEQINLGKKIISSVVVCDYKSLKEIESQYVVVEGKIPYKNSYLFYKEGIAALEAFNKLENKPDVLFVQANGILHPRRIGMASHIGMLLDMATIGVTKSLLVGQARENTIYVDKEARGYKLITKEHANPIYISPGHKISLKSSLEVVKSCIKFPHKLPEPLHLAQKYGKKVKKEL